MSFVAVFMTGITLFWLAKKPGLYRMIVSLGLVLMDSVVIEKELSRLLMLSIW